MFDDVIAHPEARLPFRSPIWSIVFQPDWSIDEAWKEDWLKKEVPNQSLISDPVVRQPGFDLERKDWSLPGRKPVSMHGTTWLIRLMKAMCRS